MLPTRCRIPSIFIHSFGEDVLDTEWGAFAVTFGAVTVLADTDFFATFFGAGVTEDAANFFGVTFEVSLLAEAGTDFFATAGFLTSFWEVFFLDEVFIQK